MPEIWVTSDTHFGHNKEFVWDSRGFDSVEEMNEKIVQRWNNIVAKGDIVFHLGDVMLGALDNISYVNQLNGNIYLAIGNHDSDNRIEEFKKCDKIKDIQFGYRIKRGKHSLILTHYPSIVANGKDTSIWNLYGHTHQKTNFYEDRYYMYHVGMDSHNCYPIKLDDIVKEINQKKGESNNGT